MQRPDLLRSIGDIVARIRDEISGSPTAETGAPPDIDGYEIVGRLGEGGMGVVYVARDEVLGRQVAIKVVADLGPSHERTARQFLREAKAMASVAHPNVVHIYSYGECESGPYIVMEHVPGDSLSSRLRQGPLSTDEALEVLEQTIAGLEAAWEKGIVHRDVKPSNILIDGKGQVRVCDFGLARPVPTEVGTMPTHAGDIAGTPHYMSPEQARGRATDLRSDIYSLGVVLYEMLTGELPITLRDPAEVLAEQIHGEPKTLEADGVERAVAELFEWMTRKDPDDRPPSYAGLRERVVAVRRQSAVTLPAWLRWMQGPVGGVAAAMLILAAFSVGLAWWLPPDGPAGVTASDPAMQEFRPTLMVADFVNETGDDGLDYLGTALAHAVRGGLIRNLDGFTVAPSPAAAERDVALHRGEGAGRLTPWSSAVRPHLVVSGVLTGSADDLRVAYRLRDQEAGAAGRAGGRTETADPDAAGDGGRTGAVAAEERGVVSGSNRQALQLQERLVTSVVEAVRQRFGGSGGDIELVAAQSEQANTRYQRGIYYLERAESVDEAQTAIDLLREATAAEPTFAPAQAALGLAYRAMYSMTAEPRWLVNADAACDQAERLDADLEEAWLCQGWVHADQGAHELAFSDFIRAIELGGTASAHRGLATLYTLLEEPEVAEQYFLDALARDPAYPGAYLSLGWFYAYQNRYDEAIEYYRQAVDYAPDSAYASLSLGGMYFLQGRYEEAVDLLSMPELSENADALSNLGLARFALGDFAGAIEAFERAIAQGDARYVAYGNLARIYHVTGDDEAARPLFETAAERAREIAAINEQAAAPRMMLAYYEAALGNAAAARQWATEVEAIDRNPSRGEMYLWLALMRVELADHGGALEMLRNAVDAGYPVHEIRSSPEFAALADEPMYRELISRQEE